MEPALAVGLMTGTAVDGNIDVAIIRSDGEALAGLGAWALKPYPEGTVRLIRAAVSAARAWDFSGSEPPEFAIAERALTEAQAAAVLDVLKAEGLKPRDIRVIGFHGQTVLHRPRSPGRPGATRQLGDGALMARLTGIDVVHDFRSADVATGGQGAPLAPAYHAALIAWSGLAPPAAVLNLGGVANITWWGGGDNLVALDTGPANGPLDDWVRRHGAGDFDRDGRLARTGAVDEGRLRKILADPFFAVPGPKSLDRYSFDARLADGLSLQDGAALLTALAAAAVGRALDQLPSRPGRLVLAGGGRKNPALVEAIRARARVEPIDADRLGWRGDAVEAECFAFLALRSLASRPLSFPGTTGVPRPLTGGRLARA